MRVVMMVCLGVLLITAASCSGQPTLIESERAWSLREMRGLKDFASSAQSVLTTSSIREAFAPRKPTGWTPHANTERPRGGIDVYASVAPAVVVVQTGDGHGSGFLVSADGLVVTNHHVIASGLSPASDGSSAMVHLGSLGSSGIVQLTGDPIRALLLKIDPVNDLAALRLERPAAAPALPFVKLSRTPPRPGIECAIIGHPASGMLWTYRPCQVSSIGDFPRDMVNLVMPRLSAAGTQRADIEAFVRNMPTRRVLLTSAQANPGDSGGPVVDKEGTLIGVTFGGPGDTDQDKFTYHVHLDEVRRFLAQMPPAAIVLAPDPWAGLPPNLDVQDLDGDGKADLLVAGAARTAEVLMFDLDNNTPPTLLGSQAALGRLVEDRKWDFEAALDLRGGFTAYYDTNNDGTYDLVLTSAEDSPAAKGAFTLGPDAKWQYQAASSQSIMSGSHLKDPQLGQKLEAMVARLR